VGVNGDSRHDRFDVPPVVEQRGDRLIVRLTADVQGFEEDEDGPRAGDTIVYRRKGDRIRPDTFTRDDLTHANPEFGPEFHRCPR